jgi:hypothetical protein
MRYGQGPAFPLWIWIFLAAIFVGVPVLVIGSAMMLRARASRSVLLLAGGPGRAARSHASRITRCGLAGLGVGALLGLAFILGERAPLAALTCAGGYLTGLLLGEFAAQPPVRGLVREATLRRRRARDYTPPWAAAVIAVAVALTAAAVIAFSFAPVITYGPWHPFAGVSFTLPGGSTSWPAWPGMSALVLVIVAVLLLGITGLRRVAARPPLTDGSDAALDELLRRQSGRAISGAVLGLQLIALAGLLIAGSQGLAVPIPSLSTAAYEGNRIMVLGGVCSAIAGVVCWLVLSGWTRRKLRGGGQDSSGDVGGGGPPGAEPPDAADAGGNTLLAGG